MNSEVFFNVTYGLYVVSSATAENRSGFVSNTVMQVSSSPARIAIAASKNNYTVQLIQVAQKFNVSVLQQSIEKRIIETFGYKSGKDFDKFGSVKYFMGKNNIPVLSEGSAAYFECAVNQTIDLGSHYLFIADVLEGEQLSLESQPLTYTYYREVFKGKSPKFAPTYIEHEKKSDSNSDEIYVCDVCGYEYDYLKGDLDSGIAPGTRFEDIPDDWKCPVCGVDKSMFKKK